MHRPFEGQVGTLGVATGGGGHAPDTGPPADCLNSGWGNREVSLQDALLPDGIQFPVELRGGAAEIVGEISPPEKLQVYGPQLSPDAGGAGQGDAQGIFTLNSHTLRGSVLIQKVF